MPIGEAQAIAAARAYADSRAHPVWREGSVRTNLVVVQGHNCWRVTAADALRPDQTWLDEEMDGGQSYLIDVTTGECIGIGLLNGYSLFRRTDSAR